MPPGASDGGGGRGEGPVFVFVPPGVSDGGWDDSASLIFIFCRMTTCIQQWL